jgi:hypothetical protein
MLLGDAVGTSDALPVGDNSTNSTQVLPKLRSDRPG